jgi:hypothetical protein
MGVLDTSRAPLSSADGSGALAAAPSQPTSASARSPSSARPTLLVLDSYERVEYAAAADFRNSASVTLSTNEPVGYVFKLSDDQQMPESTFSRLYKMVPLHLTTPSYTGGKTGIFYDAMVPLLRSNLAGTQYVYAEYDGSSTPGTQLLTVTQSRETVTVTARVVSNTLPPNNIPLYLGVQSAYLPRGHYGVNYVPGTEALIFPYAQMAVDHRTVPYESYASTPQIDATGELALDRSMQYPYGFWKTQGRYAAAAQNSYGYQIPLKYLNGQLDQAYLTAAERTVTTHNERAWFYIMDEPKYSQVSDLSDRLLRARTYAPHVTRMVTQRLPLIPGQTESPDILVIGPDIIDRPPDYPTTESDYREYDVWFGTACMEHDCGANRAWGGGLHAPRVSGTANGSPGFVIDHPVAYIYAFILSPIHYTSVKAMLYYSAVEQYRLFQVSSKTVDPWTDQWNFGGNGDGTLMYPLRTGMYGSTSEQPTPSIRLKKIRDAEFLLDYVKQAGPAAVAACGGRALMTSPIVWEKSAATYERFRACLIGKLGL